MSRMTCTKYPVPPPHLFLCPSTYLLPSSPTDLCLPLSLHFILSQLLLLYTLIDLTPFTIATLIYHLHISFLFASAPCTPSPHTNLLIYPYFTALPSPHPF